MKVAFKRRMYEEELFIRYVRGVMILSPPPPQQNLCMAGYVIETPLTTKNCLEILKLPTASMLEHSFFRSLRSYSYEIEANSRRE